MKSVILLSGKMRSGKNQLADFMKQSLEAKGRTVEMDLFAKGVKDGSKHDFQEVQKYLNNYSDKLKSLVRDVLDDMCNYASQWDVDMLPLRHRFNQIYSEIESLKIADENWYENKTEITRRLLQIYGTEIFRKRVEDNFWINQTKERVLNSKADFILITDVRFPNEIENMQSDKYELITVRVERKNDSINTVNEHESETALDNFTEFVYTVDNNGSLENLKQGAEIIIEELI